MKYHQNIALDGEDVPAEYANRKGSNFFNEGKWENFIAPLLPDDPTDRTFVEIGCNCGLFLKLATDYGFRRVVGVEASAAAYAMAKRYRDSLGMDYKVLNRVVGDDFSWDELPVADVVLLANMHYYVPMAAFLPFLDRMLNKTITCIVVSRAMRDKKHGHPLPDVDSLRLMFRDWECERIIQTTKTMLDGDPHPRRVHSMRFRGRLQRQPITDHTRPGHEYPKHQECIDLYGKDFELRDTANWRYWAQRKKGRWTENQIRAQVQHRFDFAWDIMEHGMKEPILVRPDRVGIDGGNRAAMLKLLGHRSIIVRVV